MICLYDCFSFGVLVAPGIPLASDDLGMPWENMALKGNVGGTAPLGGNATAQADSACGCFCGEVGFPWRFNDP